MSDPDDKLDQRLREQVCVLHTARTAECEDPALGRDAQRRVLQRMILEARRLEAQRTRRVWVASGVGVVLLAAAAALLYVRATVPPKAAAPRAETVAPAPAEACRLPVLPNAIVTHEPGETLALGALGELVTQPGSRLSVESSSPCELALRLRSGTLAGDLHSLRPARLVIRTDHGEVIVTGTRFSVHSDAELEVLLETGVVDVQLRDGETLRLQPRTRLHKLAGKSAADRQGLSAADMQRLAGWLAPPPKAATDAVLVQPEPAAHKSATFESSSAALAVAEAARRSERWSAAREAYQFASQGKDSGAEVALLRWARFEIDRSAPASALRLVAEHKRRFGRGGKAVLGAEAGFIEVQARQALGQRGRAEQAARQLTERYPGTPQATAASKLLEGE